MTSFADHPLQPVVAQWIAKVRLGQDLKRSRFQKDADEAMRFFVGGCYDWLYGAGANDRHFRVPPDGDGDAPVPGFQMSFNKTAELVQLFGPSLYHRNPVRQVNPRRFPTLPPEAFGLNPAVPPDPMAVQTYRQYLLAQDQSLAGDKVRALLLEAYLNHTPNALDLKTESRWAIDEAVIKGMGCLWHETYRPPGAPYQTVGSFWDSVDNLVIDPDAEGLRDAKWVARRCVHPVWEAERLYGLPPGSVKGNWESNNQTAELSAHPDGDYRKKQGQGLTNDLLVYWKVYSKMGAGGRLHGVAQHLREPLEQFGDHCYLVVCEHVPYPLNVPPALAEAADGLAAVGQALQWPTPFWADDAWPFTPVGFHWVPRSPWPASHFSFAMGELKFLNWMYSFVAGKIATTCRDFIAVMKSAAPEIKAAILGGRDLTLLEIDGEHRTVQEVVQFLQHPTFNGDIWRVIEVVTENFERRTGLTELMYGQTGRQLRSAAEADLKASQTNIRPDDMANKVEDAMGHAARAEALAARWHLTDQDVAPVLGPVAAQFWATHLQATDPGLVVHSLEYRIEAGSTRKPNRERDAQNMKDVLNNVFPPLLQACMATGNMGPVNALIQKWGESMDMDLAALGVVFPDAPPPLPSPAGGEPAAQPAA